MLPPFDDDGLLPPGIHRCSVEELVARFGAGSEERVVETLELLSFIEAARSASVLRLIVDGSFVTGKLAPNDVDVVVLPNPGGAAELDRLWNSELIWPFLSIIVAADEEDLENWALDQFGTDRRGRAKGVVEIVP